MLPARHRLRRSSDFRAAVGAGRRAGRPSLVLHAYVATDVDPDAPPRAGFVVGKPVGGAVARNAVRRRLRHLMQSRIGRLPAGSVIVVRALPGAASASTRVLAADLDAALDRLARGGMVVTRR